MAEVVPGVSAIQPAQEIASGGVDEHRTPPRTVNVCLWRSDHQILLAIAIQIADRRNGTPKGITFFISYEWLQQGAC